MKLLAFLGSLITVIGIAGGAYWKWKGPEQPPVPTAAPAAQPTQPTQPTQSTSGKNSPIIESSGPNATFTFGDTQK